MVGGAADQPATHRPSRPVCDHNTMGAPKWGRSGVVLMESEHAVFCEECSEMECVHCHDFTARTSQEVDEHAKTCPERKVGTDA